ncbi:lipid A Kdo2 1-phosphate O-methyltransferase [Leptospira borgpetersenii]|uniref:Methyltransferase n=2 Tax=Leptospira borgpetersenii serovar Hardjo-bovis TaxID=338217 RepID=Q04ST0_LEPBJ|nr:lipid A Kdo2 1-phosphate O-methyltransferase [Leptospira borgpetersenii]ABJ76040.1 Methyltransferase [Leptospira borgpetersenii serovar Hardjo-bovis str. JB197]ABJ79141.1 Methyltransferase [Leptospira borgpetersenii serovar Hardjo-bovis str. L550]AMX58445.1 methyltransferase [Leptospira borgpetersenii serovar Hardjo]AMX61698.1 methyltransferase [Leptospira borgpetersenii serovar Hardjo]AMX64942.1 methyltransferase [Leptospira borgpetersenii serovar Hardjo]
MALIEEFESQGNFLFRWRSYIPGIILILCLGLLPFYRFPGDSYNYHLYYQSFCFVISILGLFVRSFVIGYAPARTSGRNTKEQVADLVNQEGIYSLIRHPLYVGNFLMYLGAVLFLKNFLIAAVFILFFWVYYERIMFAEEQFLRKKFGEAYLSWANNVPAFIPKFGGYKKPALPFSVRNVIKREYPSLFGILVIFSVFDLVAVYFNEPVGNLIEAIRIPQIVLFGGGLVFYVLTRIVVKTTKLLHVEDR